MALALLVVANYYHLELCVVLRLPSRLFRPLCRSRACPSSRSPPPAPPRSARGSRAGAAPGLRRLHRSRRTLLLLLLLLLLRTTKVAKLRQAQLPPAARRSRRGTAALWSCECIR